MKKYFSIFFLLLSFSVVQAFVSCSASGEYDKSVETFVNSLRNGFKGEKTLFTANSVELKGKRVHIEVVSDSSGKGIKAEAMFEILAAAKELLNDKKIVPDPSITSNKELSEVRKPRIFVKYIGGM